MRTQRGEQYVYFNAECHTWNETPGVGCFSLKGGVGRSIESILGVSCKSCKK